MTDRLDDQMGGHGHVRVPPLSADALKALGVIVGKPAGAAVSLRTAWARIGLLERWFLFALACWLVGVLLGVRAYWGPLS